MPLHAEAFADDAASWVRYQELIAAARRHQDLDLSLYRFRYNDQQLVAVLSNEPLPADFLTGTAGLPYTPDAAISHALAERRRRKPAPPPGDLREQHYGLYGGRALDHEGRLGEPCHYAEN